MLEVECRHGALSIYPSRTSRNQNVQGGQKPKVVPANPRGQMKLAHPALATLTLFTPTNTSNLPMYFIIIFELSDITLRTSIQSVFNPTGE
jgi:hypothetical protein